MLFGLKHLVVILSFSLTWAALNQDDPVVVGQTFLAESTDPTDGSAGWALTSHGIAEKLFTVSKDGEIVGQLAESAIKVSEFVWEVMLKSGLKFSDGTPVDAQHVADSLKELNTKNSNAQSSLGNMTVTAVSDQKVRIKSDRPTHVMDAVLAEWVFVVYLKNSQNFVFTGPFAVETFAADQIDLIPNEYYDRASDRPLVMIKKFSDGHDLAEGVKNKEVDIGFHLPIDTLSDLRKVDGVHIKSFEVGYHYMMFHNINKLQDVRVRQAIDLAIDRTALSQALAGGTGTRSLFPDYSPYFSDDSDPHGDLDAAKALLDEAGWTLNSDGKRTKLDEELSVTLVAYPHRPGLVIMQPVIADSLTALGITVTQIVTGQDWKETQQIIDDRSFDLLLWAQHTLPAGDPLWFLSTFFRSNGGSNHADLKSDTVDSLLDSLSLAEDHGARVLLSEAVQKAILDEVPVSNLVTPFWHVGLSDRMADYEPWGSDYYVIRSDLYIPEVVPTASPTKAPESSGNYYDLGQSMLLSLMIFVLLLVGVQ